MSQKCTVESCEARAALVALHRALSYIDTFGTGVTANDTPVKSRSLSPADDVPAPRRDRASGVRMYDENGNPTYGECPRCSALPGHDCQSRYGNTVPPHARRPIVKSWLPAKKSKGGRRGSRSVFVP
jgi:hypothetical protein